MKKKTKTKDFTVEIYVTKYDIKYVSVSEYEPTNFTRTLVNAIMKKLSYLAFYKYLLHL